MSRYVKRSHLRFSPDPSFVVARYYNPGDSNKAKSILAKVDEMPEAAALLASNQILREFAPRHKNLSRVFTEHFLRAAAETLFPDTKLPEAKRILAGAYFTCEHSVLSTALYNPSVVLSPDQSGLDSGYSRIIIAFRATGSFHRSSIVFREAILDNHNNFFLTHESRLLAEPGVFRPVFGKTRFLYILWLMQADPEWVARLEKELPEAFHMEELRKTTSDLLKKEEPAGRFSKVAETTLWLAESYATLKFPNDTLISERVLFPLSSMDMDGLEDARFVKFTEDDGRSTYYATTHSFNGMSYIPRLIETRDFLHFESRPLKGKSMMNRGMALFPRKINGKYAMMGRLDGINNYVLYSNEIDSWEEGKQVQEARYPWEFVQIGNCGSPIETEQGWLVITHGVGPMRRYCLSAILLDSEDPTRIIGQMSEPLLFPNADEMDGYMPNVVYSCGSVVHNGQLILPYSIGDTYSSIAIAPLDEIFHRLLAAGIHKPASDSDQELRARRILLVEDDLIQQKISASLLRSNGYEVEIAGDGVVALIQLAKGHFDMVLSDINMPNFDGIQLLEYLNQNNIRIPVMFLTSMRYEEIENQVKHLGAQNVLNKPVDRVLLLSRIKEMIG